jgi:transposase
LGDRDVDGRIMLKLILWKWYEGVNWNELVEGRMEWRASMNMVINL